MCPVCPEGLTFGLVSTGRLPTGTKGGRYPTLQVKYFKLLDSLASSSGLMILILIKTSPVMKQ